MTNEERRYMGLRLRDIRQQRGISLATLAERADISQTHIANVEHGTKSISLDALVSIVLALDVSLDYIVLGIKDERQARGVYLRSDDELNAWLDDGPEGGQVGNEIAGAVKSGCAG